MPEIDPAARVLYIVHSSIDDDRDDEFNHWYSTKHSPDMLKVPGVVRASRYRRIVGDDPHRYIAVYEFENTVALERFLESPYRRELGKEHHERFDPFPEPARGGYVQIWSSDEEESHGDH